VNSLRNVHSTISYIDASRCVSVTRRSATADRSRSGTTEAGGDAVLGRLVAGPGAGGEPGDAGQRLLQAGATTSYAVIHFELVFVPVVGAVVPDGSQGGRVRRDKRGP
jgi:hypothetical protein